MNEREIEPQPIQERRAFLDSAIAIAAFAGASVPLIGAWLNRPPKALGGEKRDEWLEAVSLERLNSMAFKKPASIHQVDILRQELDGWKVQSSALRIYVRVVEAGKYEVFSSICPHLGCAINLDKESFGCPCHNAKFGLDGAHLEGPSLRGLDILPSRVSEKGLEIQHQRFRLNIADREVIA